MFINCTRRNINAISVFITFVIFLIMDLVCINFLNSTSLNNNKLESNGQNTILIDSVKIGNIKNYTLQNGETIWSLKIPKINLKALIAEGTEDDVASIKDTKELISLDKSNFELFEIEGADHRMKKNGELEKALNKAKEYFIS